MDAGTQKGFSIWGPLEILFETAIGGEANWFGGITG
jgi:hypothetical protein